MDVNPLRFCALAGGTDSSLVLPRDSAQARSRLQMQQHADWTEPPHASWVGVEWREVQIQSLEPWRYAAKSPSKSATNKGVGQATSCVQGHTRKRQASSLRYNAVPGSGRPSRPVFCVAVRPYVLLARHGSIEQDRTSNGPEGWIGLHTGSVSGLRGCSPQVPAVVVDEPRIFCLVRSGRVGRCQGYVPTTLKGLFAAAAAAARLETLSGSTRHWFPLARRRGLGDQRADGTSPRGAALPLFGRRPSGGVLIANEPALSSVDGLEPWTGMPFVWLTTNDRVFENR